MAHEIFDAWTIYETILDHDYMFHDPIFRDIEAVIDRRFGREPFTVLDLGCGSGRHIARTLSGRSIARYVGYDLSERALAHARRHLAEIDCPVEFHQQDLLDGLRSYSESVDVILSSYSQHHLGRVDKELFFRLAHERLTDRGLLILIDITRNDGEDREMYFSRYCEWLRSEWTAFTSEAHDEIETHIRGCDFPETESDLIDMARAAGFESHERLNRHGLHSTFVFAKSEINRRS